MFDTALGKVFSGVYLLNCTKARRMIALGWGWSIGNLPFIGIQSATDSIDFKYLDSQDLRV